MSHVFDHYGPLKQGELGNRVNGVLASMTNGETTAYSLFSLQDRGRLMLGPVSRFTKAVARLYARSNDLQP